MLEIPPGIRTNMWVNNRGVYKNSMIDKHWSKGRHKTTQKKDTRKHGQQTGGLGVISPNPPTPFYPDLSSHPNALKISIRLIGRGRDLGGVKVRREEYTLPPPPKPPKTHAQAKHNQAT